MLWPNTASYGLSFLFSIWDNYVFIRAFIPLFLGIVLGLVYLLGQALQGVEKYLK